jgi:cytochrome P450
VNGSTTVPAPRPTEPGLFTVLRIARDQLGEPIRHFERFGDTFQTELFGIPLMASRDPKVFEEILIRQHKSFIKDLTTRGTSLLLGQGLITSEGELWRKRRRLIGPYFHAREIGAYLPAFREEAERELAAWSSGQTIDVHRAMAELTMRIALRTLFGDDGTEVEDFEATMNDAMLYYLGIAGTTLKLPLALPTPMNRRFLRAREHLTAAFRRILARVRAGGAEKSVLGALLGAQESGALSDQDLIDEGITMLLAGHETSALTLAYTLALLADAPGEQRAIQRELAEGVPDTLEGLRRCSRLNQVVKESMRLYPAVWAVGREAIEDTAVAGFGVARGTQVFLYQWAAHRHPRWFSEPDKFIPGRWTPEFESRLPRGLYVPFGDGPRICVGNLFAIAQILSALATLLKRYEFESIAPFAPRLVPVVTLRPSGPITLRVRPRKLD